MRKILLCAVVLAIAFAAGSPVQAGVDASAVFEQLKKLEGTWSGTPEGEGEEAAAEAARQSRAVHLFEVSAAGTVVMETMAPGSDSAGSSASRCSRAAFALSPVRSHVDAQADDS